MQEGQQVMVCKRDQDSAIADMKGMLKDLKKRLPGTPKGALYYSCLGRGWYQFGEDSEEVKMIEAEFPGLPLAGFYANGEISHQRLYGYTGILLIFCE
ncbi:MAG: hypothetical protein HOM11_09680 [Methylococcales bacterium]|nr:hypothetical protein [Methylococcales bacterium]MBT7442429.1 hypothetical protein [Methylococcales bacterium]